MKQVASIISGVVVGKMPGNIYDHFSVDTIDEEASGPPPVKPVKAPFFCPVFGPFSRRLVFVHSNLYVRRPVFAKTVQKPGRTGPKLLQSFSPSSLPPSRVCLKVGAPIILMRNLSPK
jgi:hypothetical protein